MVRVAFILIALLVVSLAPKPVTLKVSPAQSFAPAHVILTVHIIRTPENRSLGWTCDSGEFYRSSVFTLDGENSPALFVEDKALRNVPGGDYECVAELKYADGHVDSARTRFSVIEPGQ